MNRDRNGSKGTDSSTAESRTKGTAQKSIQLALVISLDQKNTPSELEKALEVDSKMPERGVDIGDYTLVPLTSLSQVIDFIHQSPETLQSVGLVAYYDSHLDKEVISAMIGRLCSLIDPNAVKAHYVGNGTGPKLVSIEVDKQSHETTYRAPVVDPLYSHVRLTFREGKTVLWLPEYVIKSMHDDF